jgi:hypothetical protein
MLGSGARFGQIARLIEQRGAGALSGGQIITRDRLHLG